MKKLLLFLSLSLLSLIGYTQTPAQGILWSPESRLSCDGFNYVGIKYLIQNKAWQMTTWYVDSIPLNDSIPKKIKFIFVYDSLQGAGSQVLYFIQKVGNKESALEFTYSISEVNSQVSIFTGDPTIIPPVLQRTFTIACLNSDHLAIQYQELSKDGSGKMLNVEMRFMADYSY